MTFLIVFFLNNDLFYFLVIQRFHLILGCKKQPTLVINNRQLVKAGVSCVIGNGLSSVFQSPDRPEELEREKKKEGEGERERGILLYNSDNQILS